MATYTENVHGERRIRDRRNSLYPAMMRGIEGLRVSWGGVFGGVLVAIGLLLLLAALGVAIGIAAVDPAETDAGTLGTGAGIWTAASLLVALFVGGLVSTRAGAIYDRTTGFFEGALVWVVSLLLMGYLATSGISMVAGGAFKMVTGIGAVAGMVTGQEMDVSSGDVSQIAARLRDPQTAQRIASATGLQQSEVQSTLNSTAQRVEAAKDNPAQAAAEARKGVQELYAKARDSGAIQQKAQQAQPAAMRTAWITFGALVLSLLAAVLGAMAGRRTAPAPIRREVDVPV
jgi:hypothetical protein